MEDAIVCIQQSGVSPILTALLSLGSGLIGVIGTLGWQHLSQMRRMKLDVYRRLVGYRYALTDGKTERSKDEFFAALNEAFVVFHESKPVIDAIRKLKKGIDSGDGAAVEGNVLELIKTVAKHLRLQHSALSDAFLMSPFAPTRSLE